jgi:hypothetical protein
VNCSTRAPTSHPGSETATGRQAVTSAKAAFRSGLART